MQIAAASSAAHFNNAPTLCVRLARRSHARTTASLAARCTGCSRVECRGFRRDAGSRRSRTARGAGQIRRSDAKAQSGVRYIDLKEGSGAGVSSGSRVSLQWVLRRSNGHFVIEFLWTSGPRPRRGHPQASGTSVNDPFLFTAGSGAALPGLGRGRPRHRKKGGVRRIVVPTRPSYTRQPLKSSPGPVPDDSAARGGRSSGSSRRWTRRSPSSSRPCAVNVR